jgi:folate-dependent phosphoribosylglycinamide formyltransferase PurN
MMPEGLPIIIAVLVLGAAHCALLWAFSGRGSRPRPKIVVFASGTATGGGSGFRNLVEQSRGTAEWTPGPIDYEVVAVVSNHEDGGVAAAARELGVRFIHFPGPFDAEGYAEVLRPFREPDGTQPFVALSGWLKRVVGLDPRRTINIHPGPLPGDPELRQRFSGAGKYGIHVHRAAIEAYREGLIMTTAVSMHFVTDEYDEGPAFFACPVLILREDTPERLQRRVHNVEHEFQPWITSLVVNGEISWDGVDPASLTLPAGYSWRPLREFT